MKLRTRITALLATLGGVTTLLFTAGTSAGGQQPIEIYEPAPEVIGSVWLNTPGGKPIKLASRKGKVTIVQFFAFG